MRKLIKICLITIFLISGISGADSLDDAKQQGLVGEKLDGYLGAVRSNPSNETTALIEDINQRRKEKYQEIATNNGAKLSVIEKLAAKKAMEKTPRGEYIQNPQGEWVKK